MKVGEFNPVIVEFLDLSRSERIPITGRVNDESTFSIFDAATQQSKI